MAEKRKRKWKKWLVILLLLGGGLVYLHFPMGPVEIIISKETTFIDRPVNPDGTINYVKALNEQFAKGVTPENNAVPLLLKAFGVSILPDKTRDETLRRLELTAAELQSDHHFIPWDERADINKSAEPQAATDSQAESKISDSDKEANFKDVWQMFREGRVHPELQGWLAANAEALRLVEKATTRPRYYMPLVSSSDPPTVICMLLPSVTCHRNVARALVIRAMLKLRKGDVDGAWQDILTTHRLARLVQQGPTLIEQLVAIAIDAIAVKGGITLATSGKLTPEKAKSMLKDLAALQPVGDVVESIDRGERFMALDAIMMLSRKQTLGDAGLGEYSHKFSNLDWNEMLRIMNSWYDRIVKPLRLPRFQGRAEAQKEFDASITELAENTHLTIAKGFLLMLGGRPCRKARSRAVTNLLLTILMPSVSRSVDLQDAARMKFEIEKLAIALAGFHGEKGHWPAGLGELVPKYLP
ncbi:MAG: hypothetical protein K8S55_13130, partial [Phycisphaerae bacterium]|nr:hypothetical protein [Phycisphaerae bacterium]